MQFGGDLGAVLPAHATVKRVVGSCSSQTLVFTKRCPLHFAVVADCAYRLRPILKRH